MSNQPQLLTVVEVARWLGISRSHAYDKLISSGRLPVVRIGRTVRVRPQDVEVLLRDLVSNGGEFDE